MATFWERAGYSVNQMFSFVFLAVSYFVSMVGLWF